MAVIKNDIVFVPTVTITLEEYNRLKKAEQDLMAYQGNPEEYLIVDDKNDWGFSMRRTVLKASELLKHAVDDKKFIEKQYNELREKTVPMFNKRGMKVKWLK